MAKKKPSTKGKQCGFWFYTGDWLKDPELRFCSIFARGLLVDLLCFMFESKERGYLVWQDGSARTNEEIADAVSGGDRQEKLSAIDELEKKGVLSRDSRGVLFSRRMARLGEISQIRADAGSKGGSKSEAKDEQTGKQTGEQTTKQKPGVTDTVSVSDSDIINTPFIPQGGEPPESKETQEPEQPPKPDPKPDPKDKPPRKPKVTVGEYQIPPRLDTPEIRKALDDFEAMRLDTGRRIKNRANICRGWDKVFRSPEHLLACIEKAISGEYQGISASYVDPKDVETKKPTGGFLDGIKIYR